MHWVMTGRPHRETNRVGMQNAQEESFDETPVEVAQQVPLAA